MEDKWEAVNQIREFNRFYTVLLGFLNRNYLNSGYSVTETQILFELKQNKQMCANHLIEVLHLDKSYVSRLIRNFEQKNIVTRKTDPEDRRAHIIQLTSKGLQEAEKLIDLTNHEIYGLIEPINSETCDDLCKSMEMIINIFASSNNFQESSSNSQESSNNFQEGSYENN